MSREVLSETVFLHVSNLRVGAKEPGWNVVCSCWLLELGLKNLAGMLSVHVGN